MYLVNKHKYIWLPNKSDLLLVLSLKAIKAGTYFVTKKSPNMSSPENSVCVNDHITVPKITKISVI